MNASAPSADPIRDEVYRLANAVFSQEASDAELRRFEQLIAHDPAARDCYLEYVSDAYNLHAHLELAGRRAACTPLAAISPESDANHPQQPMLSKSGPLLAVWRTTANCFSSDWSVAYFIATVVLALGALVGAVTYVSQPERLVVQPPVHTTIPTVPSEATSVARITGMVDCVWEGTGFRVQGSGAANQKSEIINHNSLIRISATASPLRSGLLELTYDTGARVILQGPSRTKSNRPPAGISPSASSLQKLEKKSEVRDQRSEPANQKSEIRNQKSFAVRTPTAIVTDLGTEFGVEVARDGTTETHVFSGKVVIASPTDEKTRAERIVTAGNAARVAQRDRRVTTIAWSESAFVRKLPRDASASRADAYAAAVLAMNPAVYYRMECPKNDEDRFSLFDSAPGHRHGSIHAASQYTQPWLWGQFGRSLCLHGRLEPEYAVVQDYPKTENDQISVSAWVLCEDRNRFDIIAANWGNPHDGQFEFGLFHDKAEGSRRNGLFVVVAQRDRQRVYAQEDGSKPFPVGQWQHVAFVLDKTTLRLYRNGAEVASARCDGLLKDVPISRLTIGCEADDRGNQVWNHWQGRIDEMAVFNRALTVDEIRTLQGRELK